MYMFGKKPDPVQATGGSAFGSTTIAWDDQFKQGSVLWRVPRNIRLNDNIIVREDEIAVFYRDGKVLTYFDQPNRYALTDINAPVVGKLLKFFTGVQQEAAVFYIPKRYLDGKFGSTGSIGGRYRPRSSSSTSSSGLSTPKPRTTSRGGSRSRL
jgi:hypothetical protein